MKVKTALLALTFGCFSLFGSVEKSIIPFLDQIFIKDLSGKINTLQLHQIETLLLSIDQRLRVMSFNMLFNCSESHLEPVDRWENRKARVIEYLEWACPDVIGSQELQADQVDDLLSSIGKEYEYYGIGAEDGLKKGDIPAVFYRKDRLQLIQGETYYFSETPKLVREGPFGVKNTFTLCHFFDKKTGEEFLLLNTHLAFENMNRRHYEACKLRDFLKTNHFQIPFFITGDFNTFAFRQELDLPFFDGDQVVSTIEKGGVKDSAKLAIFGHFGPISSTNYCSEKKKPFCSQGEPGIILDHIFVSNGIQVVSHGIDAAKVDGHFPSDHFPVIIDAMVH